MREIKFRVWDAPEGIMIYFDFYNIEKQSVLGGQVLRKCGDQVERYFPLHRQPVMQFTGLKDKNGKEIYEGDVLKLTSVESRISGAVEFSNGRFSFSEEPLFQERTDTLEIIGNIYDNPELFR
jgi:uncharacterized phage protein (TIGR01671 family)